MNLAFVNAREVGGKSMPEETRLDAKRRQQAEAREQLAREFDVQSARHHAAAEIVACGLCDDDGYHGSTVCDHQEHSTPAGRAAAKAMLRQALGKGGAA